MKRLLNFVTSFFVRQGDSTGHAQNPDPTKDFTNSIGMKFVWIPPGSFIMGSPANEEGRLDHETQHKVTLTKGFFMGANVVTQEEWRMVMKQLPANKPNNRRDFQENVKDLPVEMVSWDECQEFCKQIRKRDKTPYRLPTEAEWEYACRTGTTTPFHFGETISTDLANFNGWFAFGYAKEGDFRANTTPVGSFPVNAWGLHDMHGNLWEWCQDWYGEYPREEVVDPQGPNTGESHVMRGGSWNDCAPACRSACRFTLGPYTGFRVCFSLT